MSLPPPLSATPALLKLPSALLPAFQPERHPYQQVPLGEVSSSLISPGGSPAVMSGVVDRQQLCCALDLCPVPTGCLTCAGMQAPCATSTGATRASTLLASAWSSGNTPMSLSPCTKTSGTAVPLSLTVSYCTAGLHESRAVHLHSILWVSSCSAAALKAEMIELTSLMHGLMQKRHAGQSSNRGAISQAC